MDMTALTGLYRSLDLDLAAFHYRLGAMKQYETDPLIPDAETIGRLGEEYDDLARRVERIPAPDGVFAVLKKHFGDFVRAEGWALESFRSDPETPLAPFLWRFESILQDRRSTEERRAVLEALYGRLEAVCAALGERMDAFSPAQRRSAAERLRSTAEAIRHAEEEPVLPRDVMAGAADRMDLFALCLEKDCGPAQPAGDRMSAEEWRRRLWEDRGVDPDELISWGDSEVILTRSRCMELAKDLAERYGEPVPASMEQVNALLLKYAGPAKDPEEMFRRGAAYLARTKALAHGILDLPEDEECELTNVPWKLRVSYPWGGYDDGDPEGRPVRGRMFLNAYNYTAVTDGWMKINSLHEAYPGHHCQFVMTSISPIPETMRIGARNIPIMEGMCHRTEAVYAYLFEEDPFYPLFAAYRRHHTSVRILADRMLFLDRASEEETAALYERELGFDRSTALGQVRAHLDMPGYFTCYYYGVKKITDWEKELGWERDAYTRLLFSLSTVSLETFRMVLELSDADRKRLLTGFESLYPRRA